MSGPADDRQKHLNTTPTHIDLVYRRMQSEMLFTIFKLKKMAQIDIFETFNNKRGHSDQKFYPLDSKWFIVDHFESVQELRQKQVDALESPSKQIPPMINHTAQH